jgi:hypothetical protein
MSGRRSTPGTARKPQNWVHLELPAEQVEVPYASSRDRLAHPRDPFHDLECEQVDAGAESQSRAERVRGTSVRVEPSNRFADSGTRPPPHKAGHPIYDSNCGARPRAKIWTRPATGPSAGILDVNGQNESDLVTAGRELIYPTCIHLSSHRRVRPGNVTSLRPNAALRWLGLLVTEGRRPDSMSRRSPQDERNSTDD